MTDIGPFGNALEAVEGLPHDQQEELVDIVQNRLRAWRRQQMLSEISDAKAELDRGEGKVMSVGEIMRAVRE